MNSYKVWSWDRFSRKDPLTWLDVLAPVGTYTLHLESADRTLNRRVVLR